jgi:hypothetical protein
VRRRKSHFFRNLFITAFIIVVGSQFLIGEMANFRPRNVPPRLMPLREQHILYGDLTGGGHIYGAGKPCKSEFPPDWSAQEIIAAVSQAAANDNLSWERQPNRNFVAETDVRGVKIRIVTDSARREIITAYPLNTKRNPCPRPANDNAAPQEDHL